MYDEEEDIMSARDKERFYWFKLDHEFFNGTKMNRLRKTEKVIDIEKMDGEGRKQICRLAMEAIYIKLMAEACTHNGELLYDKDTPYDDEALSEIMECPSEFLRATEERLISIRMLEKNEQGRLFLPELKNHIGECSGRTIRTHEMQRRVADSAAIVADSAAPCTKSGMKVADSAAVVGKSGIDVADSAAPRENSALETETDIETETESKDKDNIKHKIVPLPPSPQRPSNASKRSSRYQAKQTREEEEFLEDIPISEQHDQTIDIGHNGYLKLARYQAKNFIRVYVAKEHRAEFAAYMKRMTDINQWKDTEGHNIRNVGVFFDVHYKRWKIDKGYEVSARNGRQTLAETEEAEYKRRKEEEHDRLDAKMRRGEVYD